ncbi:hypothetical protein vseg_008713 [Gypsophila vaccaria]
MAKSEEGGRNTTNSAYIAWSVSYKECLRNHAANVGGYAVDGCREFIPTGEEGTELGFVCAACGCHRNFHRREVDPAVVDDPDDASSAVN